jgi:hypothetical protein
MEKHRMNKMFLDFRATDVLLQGILFFGLGLLVWHLFLPFSFKGIHQKSFLHDHRSSDIFFIKML